MIYKVHMNGKIRPVHVPNHLVCDDEMEMLERIFHFGQNYIQYVVKRNSVSVGDIAELNGKFFLCEMFGWEPLSQNEFESHKSRGTKCNRTLSG